MATAHSSEYWLGAGEDERVRLLEQGKLHWRETAELFDRIGVAEGWHGVDIGCGPLGVLDMLADRVGPSGTVVGVDRDGRMLEMAERSLAERGLTGVRLVKGEAAADLPSGSFDLVHERLVVWNLRQPQHAVDDMARVTRPGGCVALEDIDVDSWSCQPSHPAWDRLKTTLAAAWTDAGLDPHLGRRLPELVWGAGLEDVGIDAHTYICRPGDLHHVQLLYFADVLRERILAVGAMDEAELDECVQQLDDHLARPDTFTLSPTFFQAWGWKP